MVDVMLEAIAITLLSAPHADFFINLSDADVTLRTDAEVQAFLAGQRGRSFVATKFPAADAMRYHAHASMRAHTWLECSGEGFVLVNGTPAQLFSSGESRRCCYARSGPIVYAPLPIGRPAAPAGHDFIHGSQWVVLSRAACEWLAGAAEARALARHVELTYMADECFVQTALVNSPLRASVYNHNLRYIDWPHGYGDPNAYWQSVGFAHASGPMLLSPALLRRALASPALFARKVDLERREGVDFLTSWDAWMSGKLEHGGRDPEQAAIGATLLGADGELASRPTPPTRAEARGLTAEEEAARFPARPAHFGHEDVMAAQFAPAAQSTAKVPEPALRAERVPLPTQTPTPTSTPTPTLPPLTSRTDRDGGGAGGARRLSGLVFTDGSACKLGNVRVAGADLSDANLRKADLQNAEGADVTFVRARLEGAIVSASSFTRATFASADVRDSRWEQTDLSDSVFTRCQFSRAAMAGSKLSRVELSNADLSDADLSGSSFKSAKLRRARLERTLLQGTDLSGADATDATFRSAILEKANLAGATLRGASFANAKIADASFRGADIEGASFVDAIGLQYADFFGVSGRAAGLEAFMPPVIPKAG